MDDLQNLRVDLLSDYFLFNRFIFKERTGRDFLVSRPVSAESHFLEIARALEDVFYGKIRRLAINCPPGWSKSELVKNFISWATAWYPMSRFIYISYSHELAANHTHEIKQTMMLPIYRKLFGVQINRDSSAKDFFKNTAGGAVAAFGSSGAITGRDAGLPGIPHFSGAVIIDDIHKPDEVHSKLIREKVIKNYDETIVPRCRSFSVPIIAIGQRLHQNDIFNYLFSGEDGETWHHVNIKALDEAGNARYPEVMPREKLTIMKEKKPYVFSSQYMQEPIPAGGSLYKEEDFPILETMPNILTTFITVDTAETEKEWNDKTVFSFWGLYKIEFKNQAYEDMYALHWLSCREFQCEPKDLEAEFLDFWGSCMQFKVKPRLAIIEKKSTGVTLVSCLKKVQGLKVLGIERSAASGSKTQRFIDMQQYISSKQVSLPYGAKHTKMCIDHMMDITANDTHAHDDIADTCYDAIHAVFMDNTIVAQVSAKVDYQELANNMMQGKRLTDNLRKKAYGHS